MISCVGCFQQANHLNNSILKWEASNIRYGTVYECSRMYSDLIYMILELLDYVEASPLSAAG